MRFPSLDVGFDLYNELRQFPLHPFVPLQEKTKIFDKLRHGFGDSLNGFLRERIQEDSTCKKPNGAKVIFDPLLDPPSRQLRKRIQGRTSE